MSRTNRPSSASKQNDEISRRNFLQLISIGMGLVGAALVGIPMIGFLFSPLFKKTDQVWRSVGKGGRL